MSGGHHASERPEPERGADAARGRPARKGVATREGKESPPPSLLVRRCSGGGVIERERERRGRDDQNFRRTSGPEPPSSESGEGSPSCSALLSHLFQGVRQVGQASERSNHFLAHLECNGWSHVVHRCGSLHAPPRNAVNQGV